MAGRYLDAPDDLTEAVRACTLHLPDVVEQKAWAGVRWQVRRKTFGQVLDVIRDGQPTSTVLTFRAAAEELAALRHAGPPFYVAGWGRDVMAMVLTQETDWTEVSELLTESFCVMAPKTLVAAVREQSVDGIATSRSNASAVTLGVPRR